MQIIFKLGDIQNTGITSNIELNILIYGLPFYVIIYSSNKLQSVFGPPYVNGISDGPSPIVTSKVQYHLSVVKRSRCKKTGKVA